MRNTVTIVSVFLAVIFGLASIVSANTNPVVKPVEEALSLTDGTVVRVNAVKIIKISPDTDPSFLVIADQKGIQQRLIVSIAPPKWFVENLVVAVDGQLYTDSADNRGLKNCTIWGYFNDAGLVFGGPPPSPLGGFADHKDMRVVAGQTPAETNVYTTTTAGRYTITSDPEPPPPGDPEPNPAPIYCSPNTIAQAIAEYEEHYAEGQVRVVLECLGADNPQTGTPPYFTATDDNSGSITVYANTSVLATDRLNRLVATVRRSGTSPNYTYWLEVDNGPGWVSGNSLGSMNVVHSGTIAWAKTFADGTTLPTDGRDHALEGLVCIERLGLATGGGNEVYLSDSSGVNSILINTTAAGECAPGDVFNIDGTMYSCVDLYNSPLPERFVWVPDGLTSTGYSDQMPKVWGVQTKTLKCGPCNKYSPGFDGGIGVNMIGKPVKIAGRITAVTADDYSRNVVYLDDGAGLQDGTTNEYSEPNIGMRVVWDTNTTPVVGGFAQITGIVTSFRDTNQQITGPMIRASESTWSQVADFNLTPVIESDIVATAGNGKVRVEWNSQNGTGYNVWRWDDTGQHWDNLGFTTNNYYLDTTVTNNQWYAYNIDTVGLETTVYDENAVAWACPTTACAGIAINSIVPTTNGDGILAICYTYTAPVGTAPLTGTALTFNTVSLMIDGTLWDTYPIDECGYVLCDTSELVNGNHTFELTVAPNNSLTPFASSSSQSYNVDNWVSEAKVTETCSGSEDLEFSAKLKGTTNWTLRTYDTGENLLATHTGSVGSGGGTVNFTIPSGDTSSGGPTFIDFGTLDVNQISRHLLKQIQWMETLYDYAPYGWAVHNLPGNSNDYERFGIRSQARSILAEVVRYGASDIVKGDRCNWNITSYNDIATTLRTALWPSDIGSYGNVEVWECAGFSFNDPPEYEPFPTKRNRRGTQPAFFGEQQTEWYPDFVWKYEGFTKDWYGISGQDQIYNEYDQCYYVKQYQIGCIFCLLRHTGVHSHNWDKWTSTKNHVVGTPPGNFEIEIVNGKIIGHWVRKYNLNVQDAPMIRNGQRIIMFAGLGTGDWGEAFAFPLRETTIIPQDSKKFGNVINAASDKGPVYGDWDRDFNALGQNLNHVYVGFSGDAEDKALAYMVPKIWYHMQHDGKNIYQAAKWAYQETLAWCKKGAPADFRGKEPPSIILQGDPWTKFTIFSP